MSDTQQTAAMLMKAYIKTMAESTLTDKDESNPLEIDLVISGGAFNGAYAFGVILYLLELVSQKKLIVKNISGCSVGALGALCVACNNLDPIYGLWSKLKQDFRDNQTLEPIKEIIKECIDECMKDNDISTLEDRLFITKTDVKSGQHIIKSKWQSKEELHEDLISSCFVPYIVDGNPRYKDQYIDGINPHIFKNTTRKCIYIDLHSIYKNRWVKCFFTSCEKNPDQRILEGVNECCKFLNGESSYLCSWLHKWNIMSYTLFRLQFIIIYTIAIILEKLNNFNMPDIVKQNILYKGVSSTLLKLVQDSFFLGQY